MGALSQRSNTQQRGDNSNEHTHAHSPSNGRSTTHTTKMKGCLRSPEILTKQTLNRVSCLQSFDAFVPVGERMYAARGTAAHMNNMIVRDCCLLASLTMSHGCCCPPRCPQYTHTSSFIQPALPTSTTITSLCATLVMSAASSLHYLFFAIDGDGSNPPFIAVAQQLQAAGHRIAFAGLDSQ